MTALHRLRYLFLVVAMALAAILIVRETRPGAGVAPAPKLAARLPLDQGADLKPQVQASERRRIEALIRAVPDYDPVVRRLEQTFAGDWAAALDAFARRTAGSRGSESADAYVAETLRILRGNRGVMAAKAEPNALGAMFDAQTAMVAALARRNPQLCVDFLFGQSDRALPDAYAQNRPLLARLVDTTLVAMTDGMANPVERAALSDDELQQLDDALAGRGLSRAEIDMLLDGRHPDPPIDDARLCAIGQAYFAAIAVLPDALRIRIQAMAAAAMGRG